MFDELGNAILVACIFFALLGAAMAAFFIYTVPWLWHLSKPFLHTVTA
jgi:hypothetical protein